MLDKLRSLRKAFLTNFLRIHYSQFGEDIILNELLDKSVRDGFYVDVGCYHPKKFSNTYVLYKRGWHGINIDVEPEKIRLFELARPLDHNVTAAVSDVAEDVTLYPAGLSSTISKEFAAGRSNIGARTVTTRTLDDILAASPFKERQIDLLSIDIEGMDTRVLASLDFNTYRPKLILIEDHHTSIDQILSTETYRLLDQKGYKLRSWAFYTMIFVLPGSDLLKKRESVG